MSVNISTVIAQIFSQYGIDILLDGNRLCALVDDLAPELKVERRVVRRLNQESLLTEIYRLINPIGMENEYHKLDFLLEEAGFSETWKQIVFNMFQLMDENLVDNSKIDSVLKEFIQQVVHLVSADGPIIVKESLKVNTDWKHVSGMKIDRGFLSPYMIQNEKKVETILEDPYILITDGIITEEQTISDIINSVLPVAKSLLIILNDIEQKPLSELIKRTATFPCVAIKSPGYGDRRKEILQDIAVLTGGTAIISSEGGNIKNLSLDVFGHSSQIIVHYEDTIIVDGHGDDEQLVKRINQIKEIRENSYSDFDREKLQERIDHLKHGVAVIEVGGRKISEIKQQISIIENAIEIVRQEEKEKTYLREKK